MHYSNKLATTTFSFDFKIFIILVKKCTVALQLENGERLVHEFNSDNTLFKILMHWKSQSERYVPYVLSC
jgi:hypothetical protein